jgi:Serine dehydrogenase proteinase
MITMNRTVSEKLDELLAAIEAQLNADVLTLFGPILHGMEHRVREAIESLGEHRSKLAVILHTAGGVVEVAERMVTVIRHHYAEVVFIVPDIAMSAGTVLAMSGDAIMMDYASCLGPIDPQVERDGKLVPARSYLLQYERLIEKAKENALTTPEFAILQGYDQAELHSFRMACNLSIELLVKWLSTFKFKDWLLTETTKTPVTPGAREARAREVATLLMDNERWGSHGRGISPKVLREELNLHINDMGEDRVLLSLIRQYFELGVDFMLRNNLGQFAHTREYL